MYRVETSGSYIYDHFLCFQLPLPPCCCLLHQGTPVIFSRALQRGQVLLILTCLLLTSLKIQFMQIYICMYMLLCCRRFLRETLKMSNAEDLNRLTACSLVLLGHIFYVLGNHRVRPNISHTHTLQYFMNTSGLMLWFTSVFLMHQNKTFLIRKATTWLYLPCSWPARSPTCLSSSGLQHC